LGTITAPTFSPIILSGPPHRYFEYGGMGGQGILHFHAVGVLTAGDPGCTIPELTIGEPLAANFDQGFMTRERIH
jgi:hypothetical protein